MAVDATLVDVQSATPGASVTTGAGTTATGDTLVMLVSFDPALSITSVADSKGNTYTQVAAHTAGAVRGEVYVCENAVGGASHTATINFSGNAFPALHFYRITGAATASYDSGSKATATDASSPYTVTSGTLAQAAEVALAFCVFDTGGTGTASISTFTKTSEETDGGNFYSSAVAKLVVAATTALTPSWTRTGTITTTANIIVTFKEAGAATKSPPIFSRPPRFMRRRAA